MKKFVPAAAAAVAVGALSTFAGASIIFSGSDAGRAASAEFSITGAGQLVVTLTNTSLSDCLMPPDILTAILFDVDGAPLTLTRTSGVLPSGSVVVYDPDGQPAGGVVGGEWAYMGGLGPTPNGADYGISSSGLGGTFGPGDRFPGPDLSPPANPDGLQYGILSAGDNIATGNGGVLGSGGLIKNSVVFTLGGAGADFDLGRIHNVLFVYGTAFGEGQLEGNVPTPGAAGLLLAGAFMIFGRRTRPHAR